MTTLRSMPCGRGGAGGTSPAAMRSVQSANIASARSVPELVERRRSSARRPGRTGCAAPTPRPTSRNVPSAFGNLARGLGAELMTGRAAARLHDCGSTRAWLLMFGEMPLPLGPGAGELALLRHAAAARTSSRPDSTRAAARAFGADDRRQVQRLAGRRLHLRRIDQPVAAHPDVVVRLRQVGQQVAAAIVGDDDLDELASAGRSSPRSPRRRLPGPSRSVTTPPMSSASTRTASPGLTGDHGGLRARQPQRKAHRRRRGIQSGRRLHMVLRSHFRSERIISREQVPADTPIELFLA